ncbi:protein transport protein S31 [Marasmius tenuissimus]|uniref:Protein transport protein SEC31 n=1 Tax=Marasmius tenuissimus TaxID=585030 RepID=A0ABR2ZLM3_9AGAR
MKLKEIHRTSTFAWSPYTSLPLIATGTVAGALDESFSNESQLEIWGPDFLDKNEFDLGGQGHSGPKGVVKDSSRFNRLTWGYVEPSKPRGVIAAGMENGELALWDPSKILAGESATDSVILRNTQHTGPVRALDFNPIQTSLLSSGGVGGEVYIWDLKDPSKPYTPTPGSRSAKLDEITSVAWNRQVQYVLAGASSTGYTVVWDLRGKREVVALAYGGGAGTLAGQMSVAGNGMAAGGRRGMSAIAWHPDNATRLVTASEDDSSPIIMVWDLRNARAPEKILTGHEKGVLSLSWCKQDADLLLSCGKDNRALCWNPQTSEIIGELPSADNWAFQVEWCPRNPDLLATAFFDGTIGIHSIQSTNESAPAASSAPTQPQADGSDIFDAPGFTRSSAGGTLSLKQPPKWLRRPSAASFGFGGKLVSVSNLPSAQGKNQSSVVHIRKVVTENDLVERAKKLQAAIDGDVEALKEFAKDKSGSSGDEGWKALLSLYQADSRDELVSLLGFSKAEVASRVAEAVEKLKKRVEESTVTTETQGEQDLADMRPPVVSFAEPEPDKRGEGEQEEEQEEEEGDAEATPEPDSATLEKTPSETSLGATSNATSTATHLAETESNTTVPSLFGDDNAPGQVEAHDDFFNNIASVDENAPARVLVPHHSYGLDSSVAATIGSRPSSVASETLKSNTFRIYPSDESETERLVTKALVLGDFNSAVELCLSSDRFADALLLAVRGGPELLQKTQQAYFERQTISSPYLRLFQSIVTNDLADIVQNADLAEWQEIFVVLCTFASKEEFGSLAEQLGRRLEFQYTIARGSEGAQTEQQTKDWSEYRKNATLTYLAAARLERLVNIWAEEMTEEEGRLLEKGEVESQYAAHAHALQTFVEKVTVFRSATKYVDGDLGLAGVKAYKLGALYDRYFEYASALASQGLVKEAVSFLRLTPEDYKGSGSGGEDLSVEKERVLVVTGAKAGVRAAAAAPAAAPVASTSRVPYQGYTQPVQPPVQAQTGPYANFSGGVTTGAGLFTPAGPTVSDGGYAPVNTGGYAPPANTGGHAPPPASTASGPYAPPPSTTAQPPPAPVSSVYAPPSTTTTNPYSNNSFAAPNNLAQPPHLRQQQQQPGQPLQPPPRAVGASLPPPPIKRDNGGWNDAPVVASRTRTPNPPTNTANKPAAIMSPFPNASGMSSPSTSTFGLPGQPQGNLPPPPRPGSVTGRGPPGPPQRGPSTGMFSPPPPRPASGAGQLPPGPPPPGRMISPGGMQPPPPPQQQQQPPPGPYGPPPTSRGPVPGQTPPPGQGQYARPPLPGQPQQGPPPSGPYARPPSVGMGGGAPGPYNAPPPAGPGGQMQPPPPSGPYAPPPGAGNSQRPPPGVGAGGPPPPPPGAGGPPPASRAPPQKAGPPPPKYPPGDRSHIPEHAQPAFVVISQQLERLKQVTPANQKRQVEDLERRINPLFDALNCETLSKPVVDQLLVLTKAMEAHDRAAALAIHVDLLTRGSQTDDIGLWMSGIKQLIMRL